MPSMPEPLILAVALLAAGAFVLVPLLRGVAVGPASDDERDAALLRHRVALEALRDVEVDRRAGSLGGAAYASQLAEAEARAAETRVALEAPPATAGDALQTGRGRVIALGAAALIGLSIVTAGMLPATGVANQTVVNEALAAARGAEAGRQDRIASLLERVATDPRDAAALSDLADTYLAGSSVDDLVRAAVALRLLIDVEPERADAYERIVTAYLRAGDYANARAALDSYARIAAADPVEVAFFEGLIALRGEDDPDAAVAAFDRFLALAPDDPRAAMVRGLRDEAAAGLRD